MSQEFKYNYEQIRIQNEDAQANLKYMQNSFNLCRFNKDALEQEENKRNATNLYIELLEFEISNMNSYLERVKLINPNYASIIMTPVIEIRK